MSNDEQREAAVEAIAKELSGEYSHLDWDTTADAIKKGVRQYVISNVMPLSWDAAMAAKAEPVTIDRAEIRATLKGVGVGGRLLDEAEASVWKLLAAQPVTGTPHAVADWLDGFDWGGGDHDFTGSEVADLIRQHYPREVN